MKIKIIKIIFFNLFIFVAGKAYEIGSCFIGNERRVPHPNEDRFCILDKKGDPEKPYDFLIGVFDGHGGSGVSEFLCNNTAAKFEGNLKEKQGEVAQALQQTFSTLDEQIKIGNSGSTGVACCLKGGILRVANVGDSRAVLYRVGGFENTVDHKPVVGTDEATRIIDTGGVIECSWILNLTEQRFVSLSKRFLPKDECFWFYTDSPQKIDDNDCCEALNNCFLRGEEITLVFEGVEISCSSGEKEWFVIKQISDQTYDSLAMSRSFGDHIFKQIGVTAVPDIYTWPLQQGDKFLVLATDGLWDVMSNEQVGNFVGWCCEIGQNAQLISEILCRQARELGSSDDITVVVVLFEESDFVK